MLDTDHSNYFRCPRHNKGNISSKSIFKSDNTGAIWIRFHYFQSKVEAAVILITKYRRKISVMGNIKNIMKNLMAASSECGLINFIRNMYGLVFFHSRSHFSFAILLVVVHFLFSYFKGKLSPASTFTCYSMCSLLVLYLFCVFRSFIIHNRYFPINSFLQYSTYALLYNNFYIFFIKISCIFPPENGHELIGTHVVVDDWGNSWMDGGLWWTQIIASISSNLVTSRAIVLQKVYARDIPQVQF